MARPRTKKDLIETSNLNFDKLWQVLDNLTEKEFLTEFDFSGYPKLKEAHWTRDKNVKDVLIHLYEWHQLLINWITKNTAGETASFLPESYNWKTYGEMNIKFWEKHQSTSYEQSVKMLKESHSAVMKIIAKFTNEELFTKKYFTWTGTTSLGSYCVSAISSHYDWAIKKLKKHRKNVC